jgi:hypothetical protein
MYEAVGNPLGATIHAERAAEEEAEARGLRYDTAGTFTELAKLLDQVPRRTRGSHTETCWKRHAPCLANRLHRAIWED